MRPKNHDISLMVSPIATEFGKVTHIDPHQSTPLALNIELFKVQNGGQLPS